MNVLPETIAQLLLTKMKDVAQAYFNGPLDGAVITVPAYFNDAQRQATKVAAMQANINVSTFKIDKMIGTGYRKMTLKFHV